MVLRAMYSGVSGLRAEGEALGVVGDNIANVNTTGFKAQRALFEDVLGHSILAGTSSSMPGSGVRVGDIQQMFTQGTLQNTGVSTDVALNGDGFFVVKGTVDGLTSNFYTRAGTFKIDQDGALTNPAGLKVQGYKANGDGTFAASITDIMAPTAALPARATETVEVTANLDAAATAINTAAIVGPPAVAANPWDPQNPANTANFSTTMTVYDSLGTGHTLDIYFRKSDTVANSWDYHVLTDGDEVVPPQVGLNAEIGSGTLAFTSNGALNTFTETVPVTASFTILLADEPTGNLDTRTSIEVMDIFQSLNRERGITVLLITHEHDIAEYGTRIVKFRDGRIQSDQKVLNRRDAKKELAALPPLEEEGPPVEAADVVPVNHGGVA